MTSETPDPSRQLTAASIPGRTRLVCAAGYAACLAAGFLLYIAGALEAVDHRLLDAAFRTQRALFPRTVANDVVIVGIDEDFVRSAREPLALLHAHLGDLFAAVAAGKPAVAGLDVALPDRSFAFLVPVDAPGTDYDAALARGLLTLGDAAPLVLGEIWDHPHGRFRETFAPFLAAAGRWTTQRRPGFEFRGSALFCPDADGVVRSYPGAECQPGGRTTTLSERMAALAGREARWSGLIHYGLGGSFRYLPGRDLIAWHKAGQSERLAVLRDRVVLIGALLDNEDRITAPVALAEWEPDNRYVPGKLVHAQALRSMLNDGLIQPAGSAAVLALIALVSGLALMRRVGAAGAAYAAAMTTLVAAAALLFRQGHFLPLASITVTATLALAVAWAETARRHWQERQHLTRTFTGYVSPQVLDGILSGNLSPSQKGSRRDICVLFSDIRDFTALSEGMPAERVVELLNDYFDRMARIVHAHGGTVDKFIGDGLMAIFGDPQPLASPSASALAAARAMLGALPALNENFAERGFPGLRVGIGLHCGEAVIGHLGSHERHEYTAIGDTVNVAARVCDLPKQLGAPIVCTEAVARAAGFPGWLHDEGMREIKGHSEVRVYAGHEA